MVGMVSAFQAKKVHISTCALHAYNRSTATREARSRQRKAPKVSLGSKLLGVKASLRLVRAY